MVGRNGVGRFASLVAGLVVGLSAPSARAETDFVEYYYNAGADVHFYYSPNSVTRSIVDKALLLVKWTDSRPKGLESFIFLVLVDCNHRTSKILSVERVDATTRAPIATVDLRDKSTTDPANPGTMGGYLLARVC